MTNYDVVKKLIGEINPVGETNRDNHRFDNLKAMTQLVSLLVSDIDNVAFMNKGSQEYSVKRASDFASKFLSDLGIN